MLRERWRRRPRWRERARPVPSTNAIAIVDEDVPTAQDTAPTHEQVPTVRVADEGLSVARRGAEGIEDARRGGRDVDKDFDQEGKIAVAGMTTTRDCSVSIGRSNGRDQSADGSSALRARPVIYDGEEVSQEMWTKVLVVL